MPSKHGHTHPRRAGGYFGSSNISRKGRDISADMSFRIFHERVWRAETLPIEENLAPLRILEASRSPPSRRRQTEGGYSSDQQRITDTISGKKKDTARMHALQGTKQELTLTRQKEPNLPPHSMGEEKSTGTHARTHPHPSQNNTFPSLQRTQTQSLPTARSSVHRNSALRTLPNRI